MICFEFLVSVKTAQLNARVGYMNVNKSVSVYDIILVQNDES